MDLSKFGDFAEQKASKKYEARRKVPPYYDFFQEAFTVCEPGTKLKNNWHIEFLCDRLEVEADRIHNKEEKEADIIINIMPRSLKSYICTIIWNAWVWAKYPEIRFITLSYAYPLSVEHSSKTRDLIKSDFYQREYGDVFKIKSTQDSKNYFTNTAGGERKASSVGGQLTGSGGNILIIDDPVKPPKQGEVGVTKSEVLSANAWHDSTAYNRVNDPVVDLRLYVMQRLANYDMTAHLLRKKNQNYEHICIPGEETSDVKPEFIKSFYVSDAQFPEKKVFFKDRFPKSVLRTYEENMGDNYPGQVLQSPQKEGGSVWKDEYFLKISHDDLPLRSSKRLSAWDLATGKKQRKDRSASAFVYGFVFNGGIYITECDWVWKEFPQLIEYILKVDQGEDKWIENKSAGKDAVPELRAKSIPAYEYQNANQDKYQNASFAAAKAKRLRIYVLDSIWDKLMTSPEQGIINFPNAVWDDLHDALCIFINKASEGLLSKGDIEEIASINTNRNNPYRGRKATSLYTPRNRKKGTGTFRGVSI